MSWVESIFCPAFYVKWVCGRPVRRPPVRDPALQPDRAEGGTVVRGVVAGGAEGNERTRDARAGLAAVAPHRRTFVQPVAPLALAVTFDAVPELRLVGLSTDFAGGDGAGA